MGLGPDAPVSAAPVVSRSRVVDGVPDAVKTDPGVQIGGAPVVPITATYMAVEVVPALQPVDQVPKPEAQEAAKVETGGREIDPAMLRYLEAQKYYDEALNQAWSGQSCFHDDPHTSLPPTPRKPNDPNAVTNTVPQ